MTLSQFEKQLQAVNPDLHIKRYGTSMAAIHYGNEHVCRVPQGEIMYHNLTEERIGYNTEMESPLNPEGKYAYQFLIRRGRYDSARICAAKGLMPWSAIAKAAN